MARFGLRTNLLILLVRELIRSYPKDLHARNEHFINIKAKSILYILHQTAAKQHIECTPQYMITPGRNM